MTVERIQYLTDFDTNSGVTEDFTSFHEESPSVKVESGQYIEKDIGQMTNFAMAAWVNFSNIDNGKLRILLGTNASGIGKAIDFTMSAAGWKVQYVEIASHTGVPSSIDQEAEFKRRGFEFYSNKYYKVLVYLSGGTLTVKFDGKPALHITNYVPTGTLWGLSGRDSFSYVNVSDIRVYENQVFYGNVNINGIHQGDQGRVRMYDQTFYTIVEDVECDSSGNYMIFLEDDPLSLNKYFMIGYVDNRKDIQPRGVANITL
jgi:hypothetical protein